jgi:hypothetical protein
MLYRFRLQSVLFSSCQPAAGFSLQTLEGTDSSTLACAVLTTNTHNQIFGMVSFTAI